MTDVRREHDSMGLVVVPYMAYYGAQTQRALDNFAISGIPVKSELIRALGLVKWACISANKELKRFENADRYQLSDIEVAAALQASREVADGCFEDQFRIDIFQSGSGTSTNMNCNEVIANRATELCGQNRFADKKSIHPNDHVNLGQSSNDVFPTSIHVAVASAIDKMLIPAISDLHNSILKKSERWMAEEIVKIGRTHLVDATPIMLGQEFGGFARQMALAKVRAKSALDALLELPIGGTAVGTGLNTHSKFASIVCGLLAEEKEIPFREAANHFEANAQRDGLVECHGLIRAIAVSVFNIANNIRWLSSGPRCGFSEIRIPNAQPGSSIMPGKVNPVFCESLMQVVSRVVGNDSTVSFCGVTGGQFQLNIMMPIMAHVVLESVTLLAQGMNAFTSKCVVGIEANVEVCRNEVEKSLAMVTVLNERLGYEQGAKIVALALDSGKTIREICVSQNQISEAELRILMDPISMTKPFEESV